MKCLYSETGLNGVLLTNGQLVSFNPKSVINKILQNYLKNQVLVNDVCLHRTEMIVVCN